MVTGNVSPQKVSSPGLTRRSICFAKLLAKRMDARVKPAHDAWKSSNQRHGPSRAWRPMTDKFISIEGITKRFAAPGGGSTTVFEDLWLSMARGEFVCIIGHSGCGKTTVLNILAGLDVPSAGAVIVDNEAIEGPSLDRAVIFQSHALLPWLTVMGNVAYAVSSKWRFMSKENLHAPGAEVHRPRRPHRGRAQAPGGAVRRHEAARRHRARALDRAEDHADGRAVLRARRAHPRHAAGRGAAHLHRDRPDRVHDHPRRRRGDLSRRPRRC